MSVPMPSMHYGLAISKYTKGSPRRTACREPCANSCRVSTGKRQGHLQEKNAVRAEDRARDAALAEEEVDVDSREVE